MNALPPGVRVGHWTDERGRTGCTVLLFDGETTASVDVRGGAPGSTETDLLDPVRTVRGVHAVLLTGGSAFGLAAAAGVRRWLDERGIGIAVGPVRVPIVSGAVLFDLLNGDARARPDADAGYAACGAATREPAEGAVGAGTGATVAKLLGRDAARPGGVGVAHAPAGAAQVSAVMAVNAVGGVYDDQAREWVAELREGAMAPLFGANTTIGCVVTNGRLTKAQCYRVAAVAHDGLARAVRPAHTDLDGDAIFCVSTGDVAVEPTLVQLAAADAVARAIARGVRLAQR